MRVAQGATATLRVEYQDSDGSLVDPVTPTVDILNPSNALVVTAATPLRDGTGLYHYNYAVGASAAIGTWTTRWHGVIDGAALVADETFDVVSPGSISSVGPDLLTLTELKNALNIDPTDTRKDTMYAESIPTVSSAIRAYTGRSFGSALVTETRSFEYDGSGFLDIDDASDVTAVEFVIPNAANLVLDPGDWYAGPSRRADAPVYDHVVLLSSFAGINPAMGFLRNLDVLSAEGRLPGVSRTAQVTGTWGWPVVPLEVKQAAVWTIQEWTNKQSNEGLSAEAIEGYSRSWGTKIGGATAQAIPNRAKDLLAQYQRVLT